MSDDPSHPRPLAPLWAACLPSRADPQPVAETLAALTPTLAALDDGWVMDFSRTQRLLGGRTALLQRLRAALQPLGWARLGLAPTPLAALALARSTPAGGGLRHALPPRWPQALDALPVHTLHAAQAHASTLQALGLHTLGQLRAVGHGLAARTDPALPQALRQCYGEEPLVLSPWQPPLAWHGMLELPAPTADAAALLFAAQRLLQDWLAWLQAHQLGVLRWAVGWTGETAALQLSHREPVQDGARLLRLLRERLARYPLAQPVQALWLRTLQVAPWQPASGRLWQGDGAAQRSACWAAVLERLCARLGPARVQQAHTVASWDPHACSDWRAAGAAGDRDGPLAPDTAWQPPWWLPQPLKLACTPHGQPLHHGQPLRRLLGPRRWTAEAGDEGHQACIALDAQGQPWWIERAQHQPWQIRGLYA
ncbi:MAG: hypothetical protein NZ694_06460 [Tepidimonas sp.]|nr:hypothetical protein [Tepidimonas sp.]